MRRYSKSLTTESIIQITGLTHHYAKAGTAALSNVSLSIPAGACLGLLGPNGAGKSTLISILTGALKRQSGRIQIDGKDVDKNGDKLKEMSGLAPQDLAFYPKLTVQENLNFFAGAMNITSGDLTLRLEEAAQVCDLLHLMNRSGDQLSGGEKRRLNLAIALLNRPQILFLDEPTVGIDSRSRRTILDAISALNRNGTTIIYTSHYMEEVEAICDRIAIICQGKIALSASVGELTQQSGQNAVRVSVSAPMTEQNRQVLSAFNIQELSPRELSAPAVDAKDVEHLIAALSSAGMKVERIVFGPERLEDIYLATLKQAEDAQ